MKARRSDPLSTSRRRRVLAFGAPSIASLVPCPHAQATTFLSLLHPSPRLSFLSSLLFFSSFEDFPIFLLRLEDFSFT
jgi:hypothetical protein